MTDGRLGALRLVFVTPGRMEPARTADLIRQGLEGGVTAILLREPQLPSAERAALAHEVVTACRAAGALVLVSGDLELTDSCGAEGVHLGFGGPTVSQARRRLPGRLVGRSAHWPLVADDTRADYITLSPFRPTPHSHPRPLLDEAQIQAVMERTDLGPAIALGGLTAADVPDLHQDLRGVAVIRALSDAPDPRTAAVQLRAAMDTHLDFGGGREASHDV